MAHLLISIYAGNLRGDARTRRKGEPKPKATSLGIGPRKVMQTLADRLQVEAGGQAASVIYLVLPYETALARYQVYA